MINKTPLFQINIDVQCLYELLKTSEVGQIITYEDMCKLLGKDVRGLNRWILASAKKMSQRDGIVFGTISKVGIKRLNDTEILNTTQRYFDHVRRGSRRQVGIIRNAKYEKLSNSEKIQHNISLSVLGVLGMMADKKNQEKLSSSKEIEKSAIPINKTLELFQ